MLIIAGLLISILSWIGVVRLIVWSYNRQAAALVVSDHSLDGQFQPLAMKDVMTYHTVGWTVAIFVFFVLLEMASFPLWQLLGFAGVLALVYGTSAISRGETEWVRKNNPAAAPLFGRRRDQVWYRVLMVAEWASYLAVIILTVHLLFSLSD
ncbi:MAG TPA: hypothetical protein VFY69_11665 [Solirubrobacterales bacterium]|nr:hypothetical protein [Solirubrobacterales bacterium]